MNKKIKNSLDTEKAKSKFSMRKRIKDVKDINEKIEDIKSPGKSHKSRTVGPVSMARTTSEFQYAYGSLSKDPKYSKESFITSYDKIIESRDFVGIDFITIQTFITKDSSIPAETLTNEVKEFIKYLWSYLYTTANVEISDGVVLEAIEVAGLIVPVVNSGLIGQSIAKQKVGIEKVLEAAVTADVIDGKTQTTKMIALFFKVLVESAQFGYIILLENVLLFRREGGDMTDLSIIPGKNFFYGQSVIRQVGTKKSNEKRAGKAISAFKQK